MTRLSADLQPIYELEVALGNRVAYVAEPAGTSCPYAVVFETPLHLEEIRTRLALPESVTFWESDDPHYPAENGYQCAKTRHAIAGPLAQRRKV